MADPIGRVLDALTAAGCAPKRSGEGWSAQCPAHEDRSPSLSIGVGGDGRALVTCHAGCESSAVVAALGLRWADLMPDDGKGPRGRDAAKAPRPARSGPVSRSSAPVAPRQTWATPEDALAVLEGKLGPMDQRWDYRDAEGVLVGVVGRWDLGDGKKTIRPVARVGDRWALGGMTNPRPLYRLPEILAADPGETVFVVEGEKAADAGAACGLMTTTSAHGSKSAEKSDWSAVRGRRVVVLPDHDEPGELYAAEVVALARAAGAAGVRVVRLVDAWPDLPAGGDLADALDAEGGNAELVAARVDALLADGPADEVDDADENTLDAGGRDEPVPFPWADGFPSEAHELRDYLGSVVEALQLPPEAVALLAVGIASGALLGAAEIDPGGWREIPALWALPVLPSGERKSAVLAELTAPITRWERAEARRLGPELAERAERRAIDEKRLAKLRTEIVEKGRDPTEAMQLARDLATDEPTEPPRLLADEATPEALAILMSRNGERALVASAEGDALDIVLGRYSDRGRGNLGLYLRGHAGDAHRVDRVSRSPIALHRPGLALALIAQPEALAGAYTSPAARGRGLLARMWVCAPSSRIGSRSITPPEVPNERRAVWGSALWTMLSWVRPGPGDDETEPVTARFDDEGRALFNGFREMMEPRLDPRTGDLGETEDRRAWASKLPGGLARLALVLASLVAAADEAEGPPALVPASAVRAALAWAPWLIDASAHAERVVLAAAGEGDDDDAASGLTASDRGVVRWIREHGGSTTARELGHGPRSCRGIGRAAETLDRLAELGVGAWVYPTPGDKGGRPAKVFTLADVANT